MDRASLLLEFLLQREGDKLRWFTAEEFAEWALLERSDGYYYCFMWVELNVLGLKWLHPGKGFYLAPKFARFVLDELGRRRSDGSTGVPVA